MITVEFCSGKRCCPVIRTQSDGKEIAVVDKKDASRNFIFQKDEFKDFVSAAKDSKFDMLIQ